MTAAGRTRARPGQTKAASTISRVIIAPRTSERRVLYEPPALGTGDHERNLL